MQEKLETVYQFDMVHDGQHVFRELLQAMANPGQIRDINKEASAFAGDQRAMLALGCTLLDNEEKMYIEKNPRLAEALHSLTLCRESALEEADFVFLSSEMNFGSLEQVFRHVKHGTYADPHDSATIVLFTNDMDGDEVMTLQGPGVDGERSLMIASYVKQVVQLLNRQQIEYPLGIDLIFCDPKGQLLAVPRLIKVDAEEVR